jgi:hypothetical protein
METVPETEDPAAPPLDFLNRWLLNHGLPKDVPNKYVCMDPGGDLGACQAVVELFENTGYAFEPTAPNSSHQNGPVENAYRNSPSTDAATAAINGWVPDESKPCYGLPGAIAPTGYFDPIGFCRYGNTLSDIKRYREAEVQHGRVAMLAAVGYLAGEAIHGPFSLTGPANDQLQQLPLPAFIVLTLGIVAAELKRATIGWVEPNYKPGSRTL